MTPDLKADLDALLTLLASRPMRVTTFGQPGAPRTVAVTERSVRDLVQGMLGGSRPIERLPFVVHAAANGDLKPIGQALSDDSGPPPPPRGVFLCILCSEATANVPVLALSGDLDPITPPRYAASAVRGFPNGRHIVVPNRSHNDVDPCITGLFEQFLLAGTTTGLDTSCTSLPRPLHFATGPVTGDKR